jgi:hypothetical protein
MNIRVSEDSTSLCETPPIGLYVVDGRIVFCYRSRRGEVRFKYCDTGERVDIWGGTAFCVEIEA